MKAKQQRDPAVIGPAYSDRARHARQRKAAKYSARVQRLLADVFSCPVCGGLKLRYTLERPVDPARACKCEPVLPAPCADVDCEGAH